MNSKYKYEDIEIGDEVYLESKVPESKYDIYWKVVDKNPERKSIIIEAHEMGANDRFAITMDEIYQHVPFVKTRRDAEDGLEPPVS